MARSGDCTCSNGDTLLLCVLPQVGLLVAVGHILELPPALLGATVLAWGNSLSDTVSNMTMARDGYPTMAITACFASPLFILLAGTQ
jgi:sodium/potassium/calcium exchanger 6